MNMHKTQSIENLQWWSNKHIHVTGHKGRKGLH